MRAGRAFHHQRINLATADRAQRLLGLLQPGAQLGVFGEERFFSGGLCGHDGSVGLAGRSLVVHLAQIEPEQDAFGLRHVADEPAQRQRQLLDQGRRGDDLLAFGQRRVLGDVHDFQVVAPLQMFLANLADVHDGPRGVRRGAGDVEPQDVAGIGVAAAAASIASSSSGESRSWS